MVQTVTQPVPVWPHAAILLKRRDERILAIADLHIGWEVALAEKGLHVPSQTKKLLKRLQQIERQRNKVKVDETLSKLRGAAESENKNLMPFVLQAVKEYATLGEICGVLREVFGEYKPSTIF